MFLSSDFVSNVYLKKLKEHQDTVLEKKLHSVLIPYIDGLGNEGLKEAFFGEYYDAVLFCKTIKETTKFEEIVFFIDFNEARI